MKILKEYNNKRNFNKTKEPIGRNKKTKNKYRFVVQHHLARKDHFDVRLEYNGVLLSWAVPKGPSYKTSDKRLAIMVEDHPLSYRNFEGTIPKGEYGGGTVMIFDEGFYEPVNNFKTGLKKGILKFKFKGKRLKGLWSLILFKKEENLWILIKDEDEYYEFKDIKKITTSIKTGRTFKEIEDNVDKKEISINITNPDKLLYSKPKITKKEVIEYYKVVSKRMLLFLNNRLISTVRCPEGIENDRFFKKHFENEREGFYKKYVTNKNKEKEDYYYITNLNGLLSEAQMNSIEFHIWGSNVTDINHPNIMVFDLDPDENLSLNKLREGVKDLKKILDELKLKSFLKTSGGKGYHIVVPIKDITWTKLRTISKNIALLMESKWPDKYTSNIRKEKRKGKIFIDWQRNIKGATFVAPYSLRAKPNAPVSFPISWSELDKIKPNQITLRKALKKITEKDPWAYFFKD